jgi:hypothetical protein
MSNATPNVTHVHTPINLSEKDIARFHRKSVLDEKTGCLIFQGHKTHNGYGRVWINGKNIFAHRIAYVLKYGEIPVGMSVLHNCPCGDNPACVNPEHLSIGTHIDNMRHMKERGRAATGARNGWNLYPWNRLSGDRSPSRLHPERLARGDRHYSRTNPEKLARGEKHGGAVISSEIASAIKEAIRSGKMSKAAIARLFNVGPSIVYSIGDGSTWRHIP